MQDDHNQVIRSVYQKEAEKIRQGIRERLSKMEDYPFTEDDLMTLLEKGNWGPETGPQAEGLEQIAGHAGKTVLFCVAYLEKDGRRHKVTCDLYWDLVENCWKYTGLGVDRKGEKLHD